MKLTITFLFVLTVVFFSFDNYSEKRVNYKNGNTKIIVGYNNGMYNGMYTSYYENGKPKTSGKFVNNRRIGNWIVWDSAGVERVKRNYTSTNSFTTIATKNSSNQVVELKTPIEYITIVDTWKGPDYPSVENTDITSSKLLWRFIGKEYNTMLFDDNLLQKLIVHELKTSQLKIFGDFKFKSSLNNDSIANLLSNAQTNIVGFNVYEAWNYYSTFQQSDNRIIAICPVMQNPQTGTLQEVGWIRFAQLRKALYEQPITTESIEISNMDDIFRLRNFSSSIYKEANIYNQAIADYATNAAAIQLEADRIELELIEMEHALWLLSTEK